MKTQILKNILLVTLVFITTIAQAQNAAKVDSLKTILKGAQTDSLKYEALRQLSNEFQAFQPDSALAYTQQSLQLAERNNDEKYIPQLLNGLATIYRLKSENETSFEKDSLALELARTTNDSTIIAKSLTGMAKSRTLQKREDDALVYCKKAIALSKGNESLFNHYLDANFLLSTIYKRQKEYGHAIETLLVLQETINKPWLQLKQHKKLSKEDRLQLGNN